MRRLTWEDLDARARGLATHLIGPRRLAALAGCADLGALADALRALDFPVPADAAADAAVLERAARRRAAAALAILARWAARRPGVTAVLCDAEDARSVRALVRGALEHAPADRRLAGLIPTPALPERALAELARAPTPAAVAALLAAWRHPLGTAIAEPVRASEPDLSAIEIAVAGAVAARGLALARGSRALTAFVRDGIDVHNGLAAVALAAAPADSVPQDAFVAGGRRLAIAAFEAAAATGDARAAAAAVAAAFAGSSLASAWRAAEPGALEDAVLRARARAAAAAARRDPLGPAPLLAFALALRVETMDLQRLIWGIALGVPAARITRDLVATP
jgi:vacuolar-type H+-ATPase subunit C/Vma6